MEEKKTHYYFWDEMWNENKKNINKDEEIITKNSMENEED